ANFTDSTISLEQLSQRFNLSSAYISTMFKKRTGEHFSKCVERLRIQKACHMILDERYKISEIAEKVGYLSDTSFRRSFKKTVGITPSEYYAKNKGKIKDSQ
ncbi:MAG: helix-turn-helix domain-containing protein, partial [Clostridia bacterium]